MPFLRIVCPPESTDRIVSLLEREAATEISVLPSASRTTGGDLVMADVPRTSIDPLLALVQGQATPRTVHIAVAPSEQLIPEPEASDVDTVVWAKVAMDIHATGRLSLINLLLIVTAAAIAAIGIIEGQLLLIVGAMALSPDYFPIADTCLALSRRAWRAARHGVTTLALSFTAAAAGAWLLTEALAAIGLVSAATVPRHELTLYISQPNALSVVVALLAGVAGALAITLPDARGLVGVFVSITTIPAAANIGVALVGRDTGELAGAAVQLLVNVASLLVAGTVTLAVRHRGRIRSPTIRGTHEYGGGRSTKTTRSHRNIA